jgi:endonuclease-3
MAKESLDQRRVRTRAIIARLKRKFPQARTALTFENPFELLVSTILSAQCTDVRVNMVTPGLFRKYRSVRAFAEADPAELEQDIRSTGFYRNKARSIMGASQAILQRHGGEVPATMEELVALPGVGRKTANCVLGGAFGLQSGIVVDTHVQRLAGRMGLSAATTAEKVELDLMEVVPEREWYRFSNLLILHGRDACDARKPECGRCVVKTLCPFPRTRKRIVTK